jgi:hypothetical protein
MRQNGLGEGEEEKRKKHDEIYICSPQRPGCSLRFFTPGLTPEGIRALRERGFSHFDLVLVRGFPFRRHRRAGSELV